MTDAVTRRHPVLRIFSVAVMALYPALVWLGLTHGSVRTVAVVLMVLLLPIAAARLKRARSAQLRSVAAVPLVAVFALGAAAFLDRRGYVLLVPVGINLVLLVGFGITLLPRKVPMIERFALLQVDTLSPAKRSWCRMWTYIWCAFFIVNGIIAFVLALSEDLKAWALYNGLIAYVAIGVLFATEFVLRRRRFGHEPDTGLHERRRAAGRPPDAGLGGADAGARGFPHDGPGAGARPR